MARRALPDAARLWAPRRPSPRLGARSLWALALLAIGGLPATPLRAEADLDCANAMTTAEMAACAGQDAEDADQRLNQAYQALLASHRARDQAMAISDGDASLATLLRDAQRQWLAFRDAECALSAARWQGGSMARIDYPACVAELTLERADRLERLLAEGETLGLE